MLKKITSFLIFLSFYTILRGQSTIKTKEVKISSEEGIEILHICVSGCTVKFVNNNDYYWYTEFSKVKSTNGGAGGDLLHGNYKRFDNKGNLISDGNYYLGLKDGTHKIWDASGRIVSESRFKKGLIEYLKILNDDGYWIEFIGLMFEVGAIRKVYSPFHTLMSEELTLEGDKVRVRTYNTSTGRIESEYVAHSIFKDCYQGKYVSYYPDGKIEYE